MEALLGPVVIENQGGGAGAIAAANVAHAEPDGYSILLGGVGIMVLMPIAGHVRYDASKDLTPISIVGVAPNAVVVNPSLPVRDLRELVDYAKANPGKLSYGSAGAGTITHLTGELFKSLTGTNDIVHVPYTGQPHAISDLISGHILMAVTGVTGQMLELHHSGKLRMLAVTAPTRLIAAPEIPTAVEQGLAGMVAHNFYGLFAPAGTNKAIIEQIAEATRAAIADSEFHEKLIASGFEPYPDSSPEAARRFIQNEIDRWQPVAKAIGLKV
jgi:tripartite-type tricarboxylate transporter receptor subunit TctC